MEHPVVTAADQALDDQEQQPPANPTATTVWNRFRIGGLRRLAPWLGGAFAGGVVALLLAFSLVFTASHSKHNAAPKMQSSPSLGTGGKDSASGEGRNRLAAGTMATLTDSQRAELANRQAQAQLSSNLAYETSAPNPSETTKLSSAAPSASPVPAAAPMILRTAQITMVTQNLDKARAGIDQIVQRFGGYVGELSTSAPVDGGRTLTATLRVPGAQLDAALAELKTLGRVESESQTGQDVTAQYVDLEARLSNARNTEQRLLELLRQRTGKLSDVLEVETELSRVREEIERMEGERRLLAKQVAFAMITASVTEEYRTPAGPLPDSLGRRFRNAGVEGYQSVVNFIIGVALFLISDGPMLLLWVAILFFPVRYGWRKSRSRAGQ